MSSMTLKLLMMLLMVFDHIGAFIPARIALWLHLFTRPVAPVFAYMSLEGFRHTRDRKAYIFRLYSFAFFMALGNWALNSYIVHNPEYQVHNSIILSLALAVSLLYIEEDLDRMPFSKTILRLGIFLASFLTEGGPMIVSFVYIAYKYNGRQRNLIYLGLTAMFIGLTLDSRLSLESNLQMLLVNSDIFIYLAGLPFIALYNGKKGWGGEYSKYIFYVFYPGHLWILAILAQYYL